MNIKQFYDEGLAHGSYAIESDGLIALIDPGRDPQAYLDYAEQHQAKIIMVLETHPHADFASSHLEFHQKHGATIYVNPKVGVAYPHQGVSHGDEISLGRLTFKTLFTPGHSPDHNSYLLIDENGRPHSIYSGDSLFVGDVGRPDLREGAGNLQVTRQSLAKMMYRTLNEVYRELPDEVVVYPAHGAGSLCGKNMSSDTSSTIGREKSANWAFQVKEEKDFVEALLEDQPFVPKYFPYDVDINREGVVALEEALARVPILESGSILPKNVLIIDTRPQQEFKKAHVPGAFNIMDGEKFETWLGSIVGPSEQFYLVAPTIESLQTVIRKAAKIGYEQLIKGAVVDPGGGIASSAILNQQAFKSNPQKYTIVDIRNTSEFANGSFFDNAMNIPLPELRERVNEIPKGKPVVVHCAGGYRSAAGASIAEAVLDETVFDLSEAVNDYK